MDRFIKCGRRNALLEEKTDACPDRASWTMNNRHAWSYLRALFPVGRRDHSPNVTNAMTIATISDEQRRSFVFFPLRYYFPLPRSRDSATDETERRWMYICDAIIFHTVSSCTTWRSETRRSWCDCESCARYRVTQIHNRLSRECCEVFFRIRKR